jgi:cold shock CspA family protein
MVISKKQRNGQSMNMERGTLVRWNDAKGFGFIKPEIDQGKEVFIHISILKHMARKPMVGDQIEFEREQQIEGKVRAKRANIEGVAIIASPSKASLKSHSSNITPHSNNNTNSSTNHKANHNSQTDFRMAKGGNYRHPKSNMGVNIISLLILLGLVFYGLKQYRTLSDTANSVAPTQHQVTPRLNASQEVNSTKSQQLNTQPSFQCEAGKTHCSQMRTCAEATFYIKHCPGTQMDGDNDGVPCEQQHCG